MSRYMMTRRTISVIGGSETSDIGIKTAHELGEEIAKRDVVLVCGGMGGVMEAACKGAKLHNGLTIGILPTHEKQAGNAYLDVAIPTGLGYARNFLVAKASDAIIAIDGSAGTLSEIAIAWFSDIVVVALKNSGGWATKLADTKIDHRRKDKVFAAETAKEAVDIVFRELNWH